MRVWIKYIFVLSLTIAAVSARPALAQAAQSAPAPEKPLRTELAIDYTYLRSNAPPGGCTCFNLNGGSGSIAWPVKQGGFAIAADLTIDNIGNINSTGYSLTLSTFTVGGRYLPRVGHSPLQPFGQVLVGAAHASGSLVKPPNPAAGSASLAFAANLGGGVDLRASRRFSVRLAEADYVPTTFGNGGNNHQNNLRLSAGVVIHF